VTCPALVANVKFSVMMMMMMMMMTKSYYLFVLCLPSFLRRLIYDKMFMQTRHRRFPETLFFWRCGKKTERVL
jgi:hypothetical protein